VEVVLVILILLEGLKGQRERNKALRVNMGDPHLREPGTSYDFHTYTFRRMTFSSYIS
jgi:hypothetical protein